MPKMYFFNNAFGPKQKSQEHHLSVFRLSIIHTIQNGHIFAFFFQNNQFSGQLSCTPVMSKKWNIFRGLKPQKARSFPCFTSLWTNSSVFFFQIYNEKFPWFMFHSADLHIHLSAVIHTIHCLFFRSPTNVAAFSSVYQFVYK